jgi:hypothetical protein
MTKPQRPVDEPFVRIIVIENPIEAQVIGDALRQEGIPHEMRSYHDTAYDGLFQAQLGWGELRAPAALAEKIRRLVSEFRGEAVDGIGTPPA